MHASSGRSSGPSRRLFRSTRVSTCLGSICASRLHSAFARLPKSTAEVEKSSSVAVLMPRVLDHRVRSARVASRRVAQRKPEPARRRAETRGNASSRVSLWSCGAKRTAGARFSIFRTSPGAPWPNTWRDASASAVLPTAQASRDWGVHNKRSWGCRASALASRALLPFVSSPLSSGLRSSLADN